MDRRTFLKTTAAGGAVASLGVTLPGCGNDVVAAPLADVLVNPAMPTAQASINTKAGTPGYGNIQLTVGFYPDLAKVGGAITLRVPDTVDPSTLAFALPPDNTILVLQWAQGQFAALQSTCPHAACPLGYSAKDMKVECPCHGSRFLPIADVSDPKSCAGLVTHGPAKFGLVAWTTQYVPAPLDVLGVDLTNPLPCNPPLPPVVGNTVTFPFTDFPQLAMPGGSVVGLAKGLADPLVVVRVDATTAAAVDAKCTHLGCTVGYDAGSGDLLCPCHGSVFGLDGRVLSPPAPSPLKTYGATVGAEGISVTVV